MNLSERRTWDDERARQLLRASFDAAVGSAEPSLVLARHLPQRPTGRCIVVGAGSSAAAMAAAVEQAWPEVRLSGVVATRDANPSPTARIEVMQLATDADGARAVRRMLALVRGLHPNDLVLVLLSGGGSALLALPRDEITLADGQAVSRALRGAGATTDDIERMHGWLSTTKGDRLAQAARPARVVTLATGDDPAVAAADASTAGPGDRDQVADLIARFRITLPPPVAAVLAAALAAVPGGRADALTPCASKPDFRLIASPALALQAAAAVARQAGITPMILGDAVEGESREVGTVMAGIARSVRRHGHPLPQRALLLSGGRTMVTPAAVPASRTRSSRRCGRNTEFLLGLALALSGEGFVWALAGATGGVDGEAAAGAVITPDTLERARRLRLDPRAMLAAHDGERLFAALGDLIHTGRTSADVNDFRAVLIL